MQTLTKLQDSNPQKKSFYKKSINVITIHNLHISKG